MLAATVKLASEMLSTRGHPGWNVSSTDTENTEVTALPKVTCSRLDPGFVGSSTFVRLALAGFLIRDTAEVSERFMLVYDWLFKSARLQLDSQLLSLPITQTLACEFTVGMHPLLAFGNQLETTSWCLTPNAGFTQQVLNSLSHP